MNKPQPHLDFDQVRTAAHRLAEKRREARLDYQLAVEESADAERDYRKTLAVAFAKSKAKEGTTAAQAEIEANAEAAGYKYVRDVAQAKAKAALLRIEEAEANRAMLNQLAQWSQRMESLPPKDRDYSKPIGARQ